jgi:hypothetical protein
VKVCSARRIDKDRTLSDIIIPLNLSFPLASIRTVEVVLCVHIMFIKVGDLSKNIEYNKIHIMRYFSKVDSYTAYQEIAYLHGPGSSYSMYGT